MLSSAKATLQELVSEAISKLFNGNIDIPCVKRTTGRVILAVVELTIAHFVVHVLEKAVRLFFLALNMGSG
jgi:hypothetical protein